VSSQATPRPVRVLGTGVARPGCQVTSRELDVRLGLPAGTVERRSGVRVRHVETERSAASLGAEAARQALTASGVHLNEVDCVVAASASMDQAMPCNAALIHRELGLGASGVPAFDVGATCLGFLTAVDALSWPIAAARERVLDVQRRRALLRDPRRRSLRDLTRAIEQALAGATSIDARRRFRELVLDQSGGDNVRALVCRRLGESRNTEATDPTRSARNLEG
jgi:hypothetical protein